MTTVTSDLPIPAEKGAVPPALLIACLMLCVVNASLLQSGFTAHWWSSMKPVSEFRLTSSTSGPPAVSDWTKGLRGMNCLVAVLLMIYPFLGAPTGFGATLTVTTLIAARYRRGYFAAAASSP